MPIENAVWKIGERPIRLKETALKDEKSLERMILADPTILSEGWMLIGNQVKTVHGGFIDLLAIDENQSLVVIELKKNKTPREVVAQALDYASWAQKQKAHDLSRIYQNLAGEHAKNLSESYKERFGNDLDEEELNQSHQIVIVAAELDASTERIVDYLNGRDVPINVLFFKVFQDGEQQYLSRTWLLDPIEVESKVSDSSTRVPWNGEYYVSFGIDGDSRSWDDAVKYGFISAGGGRWYSRTLNLLSEEDRVWVNIPRRGYVGVGIVQGPAVRADKFMVTVDGKEVPFLDISAGNRYGKDQASDEDSAEYFVPVKWITKKTLDQAVSQVGFFGNQNSVCQPRTSKWPFTVDMLSKAFGVKL